MLLVKYMEKLRVFYKVLDHGVNEVALYIVDLVMLYEIVLLLLFFGSVIYLVFNFFMRSMIVKLGCFDCRCGF